MRQIGGSGPTQVSALTPHPEVGSQSLAFPSVSYGYKYGTDPMSNAHGFLTQHGSKQNNRNNQLGGSVISVPQFSNSFPQATPHGANYLALQGVATRAGAITNATNDHYATGGRKTKGRKTKGRKTKGRKTKGRKTKGRKTKGRKYGGVGTPRSAAKKLQAATRRRLANARRKKAATKKIQKKYKDYLDRTRPHCSVCLESIINNPQKWHETCAPGHPLHQHCKQEMVQHGMTSCPSCRITNYDDPRSLQDILDRPDTLLSSDNQETYPVQQRRTRVSYQAPWRRDENLPDTDDEDFDEEEDEIAQTRYTY
jgi:hypothetical protein